MQYTFLALAGGTVALQGVCYKFISHKHLATSALAIGIGMRFIDYGILWKSEKLTEGCIYTECCMVTVLSLMFVLSYIENAQKTIFVLLSVFSTIAHFIHTDHI